jgi:excisionase family DNA binding protein
MRSDVMSISKYKNVDELPLTLTVKDIAKVLGIGKPNVYELCHSKNFPSVIIGRRIIVPKPAFIKWLENPKKLDN